MKRSLVIALLAATVGGCVTKRVESPSVDLNAFYAATTNSIIMVTGRISISSAKEKTIYLVTDKGDRFRLKGNTREFQKGMTVRVCGLIREEVSSEYASVSVAPEQSPPERRMRHIKVYEYGKEPDGAAAFLRIQDFNRSPNTVPEPSVAPAPQVQH